MQQERQKEFAISNPKAGKTGFPSLVNRGSVSTWELASSSSQSVKIHHLTSNLKSQVTAHLKNGFHILEKLKWSSVLLDANYIHTYFVQQQLMIIYKYKIHMNMLLLAC